MRSLYILTFFSFALVASHAQNNTSPYSIIGIGDIEDGNFDRTAGMANTGISLSSESILYHANPASYSKLADHFFTVSVSARYRGITYTGYPITSSNYNSADLQVTKFATAIKLKEYWGVSVGLLPFSNSTYSFYANKSVPGTNYLNNTYYEGTGGLNQFYIANAFNVTRNLSVGLQTSYLFGSFQQTETLDSVSLGSSLITNRNIYMSRIYLKAGLQYHAKLSPKWRLNVGATASNKTQLNGTYYLTVTDGGNTIVNNESIKSNYFTLPLMYGSGVSLNYNDKLTFAGDYQYQNWSSTNYKGLGYALVNSSRYSGGVEFSKKGHNRNYIYERYNLQAGAYYNNSYLYINGRQLTDYGFTAGMGFENRTGQLNYQFNVQVGSKGTTQNNMVKETYVQLGVTISYKELWLKMSRYF